MHNSIKVAVAVIHYQGQFLLARRPSTAHQGGKWEFVGGKIEAGESELVALCREVSEELGLDIAEADIAKMGEICHDYGDKSVQLYIYKVTLDERAYFAFKDKAVGAEGQTLAWYDKASLLQLGDDLPKANGEILLWLGRE